MKSLKDVSQRTVGIQMNLFILIKKEQMDNVKINETTQTLDVIDIICKKKKWDKTEM